MPDADDHFICAVDLKKQGRLRPAVEELRKTVELEPDFGLAWTMLGQSLSDLDEPEEAAVALRQAIRCEPERSANYSSLASVLIDLGEFEQAEDAVRASLIIDPSAGRWTFLGVAVRKQGRVEDAIEAYQNALDIDPEFVEAMANLGSLLVEREPARARELLEKALELDPRFKPARDVLNSMKPGS